MGIFVKIEDYCRHIAFYGDMVMSFVKTIIPKYMKPWNYRLFGKGRRVVQGNPGKNV